MDPQIEAQLKKRKPADASQNSENRMLFFAKVVRTATEEEVTRLFSEFGRVHDVNLFRAFRGAPITKGCGLVTMGSHAAAASAIAGLDNKYTWPGMEAPMVVKWMDVALQRRRREEHLAAMRNGLVPSMGLGPDVWKSASLSKVPGSASLISPLVQASKVEISETPPAGCATDAIKLFIGNVPKTFGEEQLLPIFEPLGQVVELVVVRNKVTNESKGSAFVWYQTRQQAEQAVMHFSFNHMLLDPAIQDKPLVVRRANQRFRTAGHSFWTLSDAELQYDTDLSDAGIPVHIESAHFQAQSMPVFSSEVLGHNINTPLAHQPLVPAHLSSHPSTVRAVSSMNNLSYDQFVSLNGVGPVQLAESNTPVFSTQSAADMLGPSALDTLTGPGLAPSNSGEISVSLPLLPEQLSVVWNHLNSVQTISRAQVKVTSGPQKTFALLFTGSHSQMTVAQALITAVLSQSGVADV